MKSTRDLSADGMRMGWPNECKRRSSHARFVPGDGACKASLPKQLCELGFDRGADLGAVDLSERQALENQAFDMDVDAHAMR